MARSRSRSKSGDPSGDSLPPCNPFQGLPLDLAFAVVGFLEGNEVALVGPRLCKAARRTFADRLAVRLGRPIPNWAFSQHFGPVGGALKDLPFAAKQQLFALTAGSSSGGGGSRPSGCSALANLAVLHSAGCPWSAAAPTAAAHSGDLQALAWLLAEGCPLDSGAVLCAVAERLDVGLLAWLLRHPSIGSASGGAPLSPAVFAAAAGAAAARAAATGARRSGKGAAAAAAAAAAGPETLAWLLTEGCSVDELACVAAAAAGHEPTFRWLASVAKCPVGAAAFTAAAGSGSASMAAAVLRELTGAGSGGGGDGDGRAVLGAAAAAAGIDTHAACAAAAEAGSLSVVRWLHHRLACPLTSDVLLCAVAAAATAATAAATHPSAATARAMVAMATSGPEAMDLVVWLLQCGCQPTLTAWRTAAAAGSVTVLDILLVHGRAAAAAAAGWGFPGPMGPRASGLLPPELDDASAAQQVLTAACGSGCAAAAAWALDALAGAGVRPDVAGFEAAARAGDVATLRLLRDRWAAAAAEAAQVVEGPVAAAAVAGDVVEAGATGTAAVPWRCGCVLVAAAEAQTGDALGALDWLLAPAQGQQHTEGSDRPPSPPPDSTVLAAAASSGDVRRLARLRAAGCAVTSEAFVVAAWCGQVAMLEWLANESAHDLLSAAAAAATDVGGAADASTTMDDGATDSAGPSLPATPTSARSPARSPASIFSTLAASRIPAAVASPPPSPGPPPPLPVFNHQAWFWAGVKGDVACMECLLRLGCPWSRETMLSVATMGTMGSWDFGVLRWMHGRGMRCDARLLEEVPEGPQRQEVHGWLLAEEAETKAEAEAEVEAGRQPQRQEQQAQGADAGGGAVWGGGLSGGLGLLGMVGLAGLRLLQRGVRRARGGRRPEAAPTPALAASRRRKGLWRDV